ncbi:hypothetical protein BASA50_010663 [Batrachochytrium salamandrivorans]|uniref:Uncharacterized protein n=1 Tax=Batrachochytrium salamandrivorans TaxID=1357716 RepID=A0ABQ8EYW5_9FUNG|nr:hypothetical protein BASA50_010663 [Batrachochytrium salamandrivorans]KAH9268945.1 hypothetical protein BASA83_009079 [Batrachochytrium salamandrivorans]
MSSSLLPPSSQEPLRHSLPHSRMRFKPIPGHTDAGIHNGATPLHSSPHPPNSVHDVSTAMYLMDTRFGTTFESWIRCEKNISYICTFKRSLFDHYILSDAQRTIYALKWMMQGWSIASVSEVILKLYYTLHIDSPEFGRIVAGIVDDWTLSEIIDLTNVLLIGESATTAAAFLIHLTDQCERAAAKSTVALALLRSWSSRDRVRLVAEVAATLRWNNKFLQTFLATYAVSCISDDARQKAVVTSLAKEFEDLQTIATFNRFARRLSHRRPSIAIRTHAYFADSLNAHDDSDKSSEHTLSGDNNDGVNEDVDEEDEDEEEEEDDNNYISVTEDARIPTSNLSIDVSTHTPPEHICTPTDALHGSQPSRHDDSERQSALECSISPTDSKRLSYRPLSVPSSRAESGSGVPQAPSTSPRSHSRAAMFYTLFEIVLSEIDLDRLEKSMTQLGRGILIDMVAATINKRADSKFDVEL